MGHFDLNSAKILVQVVTARNFRKAAIQLGIPKSNVSRKVSELESHLGAKLLHRNTRSVSLTEAGREFVKHAEEALKSIEAAERAVAELHSAPRGQVRVAATVSLGQALLSRLVAEFLKEFPEISIVLHLSDREVDLVSERFDVAIRAGKLPDSSLVTKLIGRSSYCLVASPSYVRINGCPDTPEDLVSHNCLRHCSIDGEVWGQWPLKQGGFIKEISVKGQLISDDFSSLRDAALSGVGIARLPSLYVREQIRSGRLISILPELSPPETPINLIHPPGRILPKSTRSFIEFVHPRLKEAFQDSSVK